MSQDTRRNRRASLEPLGVAEWPDDEWPDVEDERRDDAWLNDDEVALPETRPLPALRALPGETTNGLRAALVPLPRARAYPAAWTSAPTRHVPAHLPALDVAASSPAIPRRATTARPLRAVNRKVRRFCEAPTDKHTAMARALPHGGMLIPGGGRALAIVRPRPGRPCGRPAGGLAGVLLTCALLAAAAFFAKPAEPGQLNFDGLSANFSLGMWQAQAGGTSVLGSGGAAAPGVSAPGTAGGVVAAARSKPTPAPANPAPPAQAKPATSAPSAPAPAPQPPASAVSPAPFSPWPPSDEWMRVPGHAPYAVSEPPGDPYAVAFGQCTWWAQHERPDENLRNMGNARYWATGAQRRGYRVGTTPARGATAVFQPGVQGAGWAGHVAHVLVVYPGGWFLVSEMNAYGNGGGWGRVSFRYAHGGPGVSFIY